MKITLDKTDINELYLMTPMEFFDGRGSFLKIFQSDAINEIMPGFEVKEVFFSTSHKDVLRGMHFFTPPYSAQKIVTCVAGSILDVIVDLRRSSKTYGKAYSTILSAKNRAMYLIPKGCAHGFLSLEDHSITLYATTTVHVPSHDCGIHYNSFGFDWPVKNPFLSDRDQSLASLEDFESPFE
ncbi:MAG: dTDP-4-dehydrorhamnose 3,5-epimerase family protein [Verrucomicrobiota bacterium]|nr:dTDP-4-dehydrorhamnose 3,5-epimerase family protein [Verrucomicrobiota bacterium]